jgi:tRNA pseudouridine55 synthase
MQAHSLTHPVLLSTQYPGILLLNKPTGCTSQQAVSRVKRLFDIKKAGHTGSLDPIATGLLPVCLGEATKFSQFLLTADKHYRVRAKLGQRTNTGDCEGTIIEQKPIDLISAEKLQDALSRFRGKIFQIPPLFSAIKHEGKPLYHWARKGISVPRATRPVTINTLKLLHYQIDQLDLEVHCSKGTYIRTLIEDIGTQLGYGAHVTGLHRLSVGKYHEDQSVSFTILDTLHSPIERMKYLLPIDNIFPQEWPTFTVSEPAAFYLRRGQALALPKTPQSGWVCLRLKTDQRLLGVGQILKDGRLAPHRLIQEV